MKESQEFPGKEKRDDTELCETAVVSNLVERSSWKLNNSASRHPRILTVHLWWRKRDVLKIYLLLIINIVFIRKIVVFFSDDISFDENVSARRRGKKERSVRLIRNYLTRRGTVKRPISSYLQLFLCNECVHGVLSGHRSKHLRWIKMSLSRRRWVTFEKTEVARI